MEKFHLSSDNVGFVFIDIQERLANVMKEKEKVVNNCLHLIELAKLLDIPLILTEQYPKGLGITVEEIRKALPEYKPIEKITFSCCDEPSFLNEIKKINRKTLILTGMETHVCVLQTCIGLLSCGYNIHVIKDAICSRTKDNWKTGIEFMRDSGAVITCTETVLFQLLRRAGTQEFKAIVTRIK